MVAWKFHTFLLQDCLISSTSSSLLSISFECVCLSLSISISRRSLACRSQHQHLSACKSTLRAYRCVCKIDQSCKPINSFLVIIIMYTDCEYWQFLHTDASVASTYISILCVMGENSVHGQCASNNPLNISHLNTMKSLSFYIAYGYPNIHNVLRVRLGSGMVCKNYI